MSHLNLYFLRHGETLSSQSGTYCGILDIDLTGEGYLMAEDFASAYQDMSWQAIYASPLKRTQMTAKPLAEHLGLKIEIKEGLREIYYGQWEGKTPEEVNSHFHDDYVSWLADPGWNSPTGGEKGIDIARRSSEVIEEIQKTHHQGNILIVSHKATIRILLCSLLGIDLGRFRDRIGIPVASLSIVEIGERGPLVKVMGDRCHLRAELRARHGS